MTVDWAAIAAAAQDKEACWTATTNPAQRGAPPDCSTARKRMRVRPLTNGSARPPGTAPNGPLRVNAAQAATPSSSDGDSRFLIVDLDGSLREGVVGPDRLRKGYGQYQPVRLADRAGQHPCELRPGRHRLLPQIWTGRWNPLRNGGDFRQWAVQPPSMHNDAPLIRAASGEQR